ncbi:MAG: virulence protein RhuM/Fic/DOC family protein [Patescibacteria group bacterium]
MKKVLKRKNEVVVYQAKSGAIELRGDFGNETIWATQAEIARIFEVNPPAITKHIKNIYKEGELLSKATCSNLEQVREEGQRTVKRTLDTYNLDMLIAVGYRINSVVGTKFRQWATKTLRQHITKGYTINPSVVKKNYGEFQKAVENIRHLLPSGAGIDNASVVELMSAFADTWLSLAAYDEEKLPEKGVTKKSVALTGERLEQALVDFKFSLTAKGEITELFGVERHKQAVSGIVGNVMQSFGGTPVYNTVEEKAAHLLYFMVKNHPFVDGNKRSGAYSFIWFLNKAGALDRSKITPATLTALTLFVAESDAKHKEKMIRLILQLLKK